MVQPKMNKALWHISREYSQLQEVLFSDSLATPLLEIKSLYSLISTGSEYLVASGQVPPTLFQSMKIPHMEGGFEFPLTYGYSLVGAVQNSTAFAGKKVHLLHPHQNYCQVSIEEIFLIPDHVPLKRATLASNLETALTATWDANVQIGDKVLIVGFGMIGALIGRLLSFLPSVEVVVLEKDEYRKEFAQKMGFSTFESLPQKKYYDLAFHTSGTNEGLQNAIDGVGMEGKIMELSWYGTKHSNISLGGDFHQMRKQIISSQVSHIPANKSARWNYRRRKEVVFSLLMNPLFDEHITHEISFDESPTFFHQLRNHQLPKGIGWCIKY